MDRAHLDLTPYTPEQLEWLPRAYELVSGAWSEVSSDGLELRCAPGRFGDVWSLCLDGFNWMNTNPVDLLDHRKVLEEASGDVLLTGLGLGVGVLFASANPAVTSITVIESDRRVDKHVWPQLARRLGKPGGIVITDADTHDYSKHRYDFAFVDHTREAPPLDTLVRIGMASNRVVVWWDEVQEVLASWR